MSRSFLLAEVRKYRISCIYWVRRVEIDVCVFLSGRLDSSIRAPQVRHVASKSFFSPYVFLRAHHPDLYLLRESLLLEPVSLDFRLYDAFLTYGIKKIRDKISSETLLPTSISNINFELPRWIKFTRQFERISSL